MKIEDIEKALQCCEGDSCPDVTVPCDECEYNKLMAEALKKQIPKNVIVHEQIRGGNTTRIDLECPACGFWQGERHIRSYCPMCGQRLK